MNNKVEHYPLYFDLLIFKFYITIHIYLLSLFLSIL